MIKSAFEILIPKTIKLDSSLVTVVILVSNILIRSTSHFFFPAFQSYDQYVVHLDSVRIMHLIIAATPGLTPRHLHNTEGGCYSLISILLL